MRRAASHGAGRRTGRARRGTTRSRLHARTRGNALRVGTYPAVWQLHDMLRVMPWGMLLAAMLSGASATAPLAAVPCLGTHVGCNATFGTNNSGCCALADPEAVCCQTVLVGPTGPIVPGNEGLKRSYCCPSGSQCTERGCTVPIPAPRLCGPTQGDNCNVSYLCTSGPADWTRSASAGAPDVGKPAVLVIGDSVSDGWTPVLAKMLAATHTVVHSPGRMTDGGARSTSNLVNCAEYLLATDLLEARAPPT